MDVCKEELCESNEIHEDLLKFVDCKKHPLSERLSSQITDAFKVIDELFSKSR